MAAPGYSGTPLGRKLGYRAGMRVFVEGMPEAIRSAIEQSIGEAPDWRFAPEPGLDAAHIFVTERSVMAARLAQLRGLVDPAGFVWVSWPKRASRVDTDITEDVIRAMILPDTAALAEQNWVDVKVCAIDETWSGLKLVVRKERR